MTTQLSRHFTVGHTLGERITWSTTSLQSHGSPDGSRAGELRDADGSLRDQCIHTGDGAA
jgi:hypothetical protein